jgi:hypothetical protein
VLRDEGMSYGDYVEQLTYLLFLKMADEGSKLPPPLGKPSIRSISLFIKTSSKAYLKFSRGLFKARFLKSSSRKSSSSIWSKNSLSASLKSVPNLGLYSTGRGNFCRCRSEILNISEGSAYSLFSVDKHLRIFSAFQTAKNVKIWCITEADRSATTLLLPSEY